MTQQAIQDSGRPQRDPAITWREYGRGILTENGLAMNPTAAFVFKSCDGEREVAAIVASYEEQYAVPRETAEEDVRSILAELDAQKVLVA